MNTSFTQGILFKVTRGKKYAFLNFHSKVATCQSGF